MMAFCAFCGFNTTRFGSYARGHHQADKTPKKRYYVIHLQNNFFRCFISLMMACCAWVETCGIKTTQRT